MAELATEAKAESQAWADDGGKAAPSNGKDAGGDCRQPPCHAACTELCKEQYDLPIDKGWAWVVAISASLVFAFCGGALRAHGLIYVEVMQEYKSPPTETYWIFGLGSAIAHGFAPVPGYLIQRFNHRVVLIGGSLLMSLGICVSGYMPDYRYMFFSFSVIYGIGLCFTLLTAFVCVGPYFNRRRTLATGIASAGSGVGAVVVSFVLRFLFDELSFDGAMLLYGGLLLDIVVLAALQRPIVYYTRPAALAAKRRACAELPQLPSLSAREKADAKSPIGDASKSPLVARRRGDTGNEDEARRRVDDADAEGDGQLFRSLSVEGHRCRRTITGPSAAGANVGKPLITVADIIHASAHSLPLFGEADSKAGPAGKSGVDRGVYVRILKSGTFWCIGLSIFCYAQGFSLSYSIVPAYAASISVGKGTVAWLIAAGGFGEAVGRLTNGYLSDLKLLSPTVHYTLLPLLPAFAAFLCPLISGSVGVGLFLVVAGLLGSSMFPFQTAVLREQLGDECVTPGLSMLFVFQTVGYVAAALMTSVLYDLTQSWKDIFYYVSTVMFAASFCSGMLSFRKLHDRCKASETLATL